jgi:SecD/SecF fusion protein
MLHFPTWKTAIVLIVLLVGTVLAIPSLMPRATLDKMPSWFPKQTVTLGLDLQGGAPLLYEVGMTSWPERLTTAQDDTAPFCARQTSANRSRGQNNAAP